MNHIMFGEGTIRPRPRRVRFAGRGGLGARYLSEPCTLCGEEMPTYRVETADHVPLGCERCLLIYRDGIAQL